MEREQIIKALECCTFNPKCEECPIRGEDCINLSNRALEVIKELIAEKEDIARKIFNEIESWFAIDCNLRIITNQKFYELRDKYIGENRK